jgi:DAK2 domain fusion protein YloV
VPELEINGKTLRDAIVSGANAIINRKNEIDELNVFPVPDGDTGTNMSMTIKNAVKELSVLPDDAGVDAVSAAAAGGMLRGARGNSGVILSLLFRGLSKGLRGKKTATAKDYAAALQKGVEAAYKSVMKPTEGTILTVAREGAHAAEKQAALSNDFVAMFESYIEQAEKTLAHTPELLPVLKKAGVVDAGGKGYTVILGGMLQVFKGGGIVPNAEQQGKAATAGTSEDKEVAIEFTYCTEYIVVKSPEAKDAKLLRAYLETIGDGVVLTEESDIIKVRVHTDHPGKALEEGLLFGSLINLKILNLRENRKLQQTAQHKNQAVQVEPRKSGGLPPAEPEKPYGFVTVANGHGLETIFTDLGADHIVRGGQTSNPSTEDILEAVMATPAENVFILPNNKNIIMAAEQAARLASGRNVIVLQSRTIPQGIAAMLAFDPEAEVDDNSSEMTQALDRVSTGSVTFAVRDTEFEDKGIRKGDILAMENGKLAYVEREVSKALYKITKKLIKSDTAFVTVIYGSDVTDENANEAFEYLKAKLGGGIEFSLVNGGQPIYYYIVSAE